MRDWYRRWYEKKVRIMEQDGVMKDGKLTSRFRRWQAGVFLIPLGTLLLASVVSPLHPVFPLLAIGAGFLLAITIMLRTGTAWAAGFTRIRLVERSSEPWHFWFSFSCVAFPFAMFVAYTIWVWVRYIG